MRVEIAGWRLSTAIQFDAESIEAYPAEEEFLKRGEAGMESRVMTDHPVSVRMIRLQELGFDLPDSARRPKLLPAIAFLRFASVMPHYMCRAIILNPIKHETQSTYPMAA